MGPHSTLISYLHRAISIMTGNMENLALGPHTSLLRCSIMQLPVATHGARHWGNHLGPCAL